MRKKLSCALLTTISIPLLSSSQINAQAAPERAPQTDWSRALVASTMKRYPTATDLGSWGYAKALFLFGEYLVWKRTGDSRYLQYIKDWMDSHVDAQGNLDHNTESLDAIMPGNLLLLLYQETGEQKYKLAADKIRHRFDTYPRTSDGGFWHATGVSRQHQLWGDGVFMGMPFLVRYGRLFGESAYANDEAAKQLIVYASHLHSTEGLLYHSYDESGASSWANAEGHHSPEFWCRAMGWFGMTLIDVLDVLPSNHPRRQELIAILQDLVRGLAKYQDSKTGLWYQVVDKGSDPANWLETSSSSMYSYVIAMAVRKGYVNKSYAAAAAKGYRGVLTKLSLGPDGLANIADICEGTNVGDLAFYYNRKRNVNDFHGLGAFLIMNEYFLTGASAMELTDPRRKTFEVAITNPTNEPRTENVVLRVAEIRKTAPDFNAESAIVTMADDSSKVAPGIAEIPSQADDLDGDHKADELVFQLPLGPRQTRTVNVAYGDPDEISDYPRRTSAKFAKHYDGMGWESETTAWRLYFDKRNAIDLWGKRKPGLYLETFAAPDYKYQEEASIGRDIYNVGKSLGAGGVGAWLNGQAIPISEVSNRNWKIISTGPVRSIVEFDYDQWKIGDRAVSLTSRITQWAGERGYEHSIAIQGSANSPLVAGISRKPGLKQTNGGSSCSISLWGHQVVKPGTGATESLPDQNLGLAIIAPSTPRNCQLDGDPENYLIRPAVENGTTRWYVLGAWDQEEQSPIHGAREFANLVNREMLRLAKPAEIKLINGPQSRQAAFLPAKPADDSALDTVKYFSSTEVNAAFQKGAPILNKDGTGGRTYSVLAGRRDKPGQSELHEKDTDVFYIVDGSATFVTGGRMLEPKNTAADEVRGSAIEGGETRTLSKGDVIVIPARVPHWFKDVQGTLLYFVVKVQ